jgi:hypothetical protein
LGGSLLARRQRLILFVIDTGKQARVANLDDPPRAKHDNSPPKEQQQPVKAMVPRASEPLLSGSAAGHNHATAHAVDSADVKAKHKRIPDENIAKLVAEENESKSKFPVYPGLERWELLEKMGDGAFSNVYRARDREGSLGEVAIKVVRKFEMNSMQVCDFTGGCTLRQLSPLSLLAFFFFRFYPSSLYQL